MDGEPASTPVVSLSVLSSECRVSGTLQESETMPTLLSPRSTSSSNNIIGPNDDLLVSYQYDYSNAHSTPSEIIQSYFVSNTFWSNFSLTRSNADGHCIIHSLATCLNHLHDSTYNVDFMLHRLLAECDTFNQKYKCYWPDGLNFHEEMKKYVHLKEYRSLFCEFVPNIMANALSHIVIVINVDNLESSSPMNVYDIVPDDYIDRKPVCNLCGLNLGTLVILRRVNHYDACVQRSKLTKSCSCNISAPTGRLNTHV